MTLLTFTMKEVVLHADKQGVLSYHKRLSVLAQSATKGLLPPDMRFSIRQVTDDDDEAI